MQVTSGDTCWDCHTSGDNPLLSGLYLQLGPGHPQPQELTYTSSVCAQNMTSTVVKTTLRNDLYPEGVIHHLQILSPIQCVFRNDLLTSSGYTPQWG